MSTAATLVPENKHVICIFRSDDYLRLLLLWFHAIAANSHMSFITKHDRWKKTEPETLPSTNFVVCVILFVDFMQIETVVYWVQFE